ncbi:hypothetical protein [uncultured Jannaschia sp.]|uniref:hypothetical protein n=1 Tax=uncultured Jannaschia sp. TaxID=293347 RepID=UPI002612B4B6|nr:hypothetical protein [uncultured Jannaschia sp.]
MSGTSRKTAELARLRRLADLRTDRSAARLARIQGLIDELEGRAGALRDARPEPPASIGEAQMQDRWNRWRREQVTMLNTQVARLNAVAQPQRETLARDRARAAVLGKLKDRLKP